MNYEMKKILLIILPLLLIVGCEKQKEYSIDNIIEREGIYYKKFTEEIVNGFVFEEIEGTKVKLGRMKNGKKDGKWIDWYENGQKKKEVSWKDGNYDGKRTEWYENGQKKYQGTYKDDKQNGLSTDWYENGQKKYEGTSKDGKQDGLFTLWFENGQKVREETYKEGELISNKYWDPDGIVKY